MSKIALAAANATCAHCARRIVDTLSREKGIVSVQVDGLKARVLVGFDAGRTSTESILGVMERSGYPARLIAEAPAMTHTPQWKGLQRVA